MSLFQKLMMTDIKKEESTLPSDYTQLEYIESSGTQYIDTGFKATSETLTIKTSISKRTNTSQTNGNYFGFCDDTQDTKWCTVYNSASSSQYNNPTFWCATTQGKSCWDSSITDDLHNIEIIIDGTNKSYVAKDGGNIITTQSYTGTFLADPGNYMLFTCGSTVATTTRLSAIKMGYHIIYQDNVLVRNLIPAKRNSDSVIGMYDTVNDVFYTNSGTGTFTAGAEISKYPLEIPKVSYNNNAIDYSMYGESKQEYITIDDVQYKIPTGYTVLSSITFPSGAYLTTNIIPTTYDYEVTFKGSFGVASAGPNCAYGYMGSSGQSIYPRYLLATWNTKWLSSPNATTGIGEADTDDHTFITEVYEDSGTPKYRFSVDGTALQDDQTMNTTSWATNTLPFYIGARNNEGTAGNYGLITARQWSVKKADVLVAMYIPMKNSSNVLGMYDFVTNTFYTNAGTGTFVSGNESPCPDQPLDVVSVGSRFVTISNVNYPVPNSITLYTSVEDTNGTTYTATGYIYPAKQGNTFGLYHFDTKVFQTEI